MTYDDWVNENYDRLERFARSRGGGPAAVDEAVRRTLESEAFPANNGDLWWSWHCSAIRSVLSNERRGGKRAIVALEHAGAIHTKQPLRPADTWAWSSIGARLPFVNLHLNWRDEVTVQHVGACRRCAGRLYLRFEREVPGEYFVPALGCANGHRQYQEVAR